MASRAADAAADAEQEFSLDLEYTARFSRHGVNMFQQIIEFTANHYILTSIFAVLLVAFIFNESQLGGATVSPSQLVLLMNNEQALVLDVRDSKDFKSGHIVAARNLPYANVDDQLGDLEKYKSLPVVVVCKLGQHSGAVGKKLKAAGFQRVSRLRGGIAEWRAANMPLVKT